MLFDETRAFVRILSFFFLACLLLSHDHSTIDSVMHRRLVFINLLESIGHNYMNYVSVLFAPNCVLKKRKVTLYFKFFYLRSASEVLGDLYILLQSRLPRRAVTLGASDLFVCH